MTKRCAFSPCLGLNVNVVRFCARGKKRGRGDGGARRGISELGYLNWGGDTRWGAGCALSTWRFRIHVIGA